jgi:hypothetical protein
VTALTSAAEAPTDPSAFRAVQLLIANVRGEGEKLARRIFGQRPDLRILVIGEHENEPGVTWIAPERQARLNKPYALSELLRASRRLLDA